MNVQDYLERIHYMGELTPDAETLRQLHLAHLLSVPFENLDIHLGQPIVLNEAALFDKIVTYRRGGFCYELNGLFAGLLRELGFDVTMLAAGVVNSSGDFDPIFDHLTLMVRLDERWLADVGFGDSFREPLLLDKREAQYQNGHGYRLLSDSGNVIYQEQGANGLWNNQYRFGLQGYQLPDYDDYCLYHQTSPQSHFTQKRICTLATPEGRITLSDMRFITTIGAERRERVLDTQDEYNAILRGRFGIAL
jgi:N-hydroxyarylamine O-acetyltransferase